MNQDNYLTNIPEIVNKYGFCKVLAVRHESIHLKHIFTEIFVRKSIDVYKYLNKLDLSLEEYMEIMTNRMRRVYKFNRDYQNNCNDIVKNKRTRFFPTQELYEGLETCIVLDFDGVITKNSFKQLYELCILRNKVYICSANPSITEEWFKKKGLSLPEKIFSMKGKNKKIKQLIEISKKHDYVFYVDNEIEYLKYAWIFGIQTFHWNGKQIKYFSMLKGNH